MKIDPYLDSGMLHHFSLKWPIYVIYIYIYIFENIYWFTFYVIFKWHNRTLKYIGNEFSLIVQLIIKDDATTTEYFLGTWIIIIEYMLIFMLWKIIHTIVNIT